MKPAAVLLTALTAFLLGLLGPPAAVLGATMSRPGRRLDVEVEGGYGRAGAGRVSSRRHASGRNDGGGGPSSYLRRERDRRRRGVEGDSER